MKSTFLAEDVTVLLKDISGRIEPSGLDERERRIQHGGNYAEMLPGEYEPGEAYIHLYEMALERFAPRTAEAAGIATNAVYARHGGKAVLVSLARAGTSTGIVMKWYARRKYGADWPHYTLSIIKGKGIDRNALGYILDRHAPGDIQFVDGWTGKGAIAEELREAVRDYPGLCPDLAVLADPSRCADIAGSFEDFLIPSSCLNAVVSGLLSRTVLNEALIGKGDFHGAVFYEDLLPFDRTYQFIDRVAAHFNLEDRRTSPPEGAGRTRSISRGDCLEELGRIREDFSVPNLEFIKPGIGEATRVLLRRKPWKILVHRLDDEEYLGHLYQLAGEKGAEIEACPLSCYRACGIIRTV